MATSKSTKTTGRKAINRKATPRTATKAAPRFEPRVGDQKALEAAVAATGDWKDALAKRDQAIRAAVKGGTSARQVALAVGLTHPGVLKIVKR